MPAEVIELEEITVCPKCGGRLWEIVETLSSHGPFGRCAECSWEEEKSDAQ